MWAVRRFQRQLLKPLPLFQNRGFWYGGTPLQLKSKNEILARMANGTNPLSASSMGWVNGIRLMSTTKGRSMRSKVEKRMRRETGKTLREIRRAKKLRKKLMTEEERLIYNLRRAKKKVALLLQKLKKYELPELPAPRHDPELLTAEQLQAYKKIGFRNRNYVPVGVRGVFGGVVQNMHLHWKFHETVQVCCDNFPKEKIKEMATMLSRLSGGIVVNIHNVKTIVMFRGRNYRQPKNLIPINTLTKRKALFKARFEQALDSQKLNIKKIEQQLRRKGVNPEDPIAMASIQRVASTFFRAIDDQQGTPYVFRGEQQAIPQAVDSQEEDQTNLDPEDSDQEELDRFIAEIEDAADQEWAPEEAAEKEETSRIMYWGKEDMGVRGKSPNWQSGRLEEDRGHGSKRTMNIRKWDSGDEVSETSEGEDWGNEDMGMRCKSPNRRSGSLEGDRGCGSKQRTMNIRKWESGDEVSVTSEGEDWGKEDMGMRGRSSNHRSGGLQEDRDRGSKQRSMNTRKWDSGDEVSETSEGEDWDPDNEADYVDNAYDSEGDSHDTLENTRMKRNQGVKQKGLFNTRNGGRLTRASSDVGTESDIVMFSESDSPLWESDKDEECSPTPQKIDAYEYISSGDSDEEIGSNARDRERTIESKKKTIDESWDSD